MARCSKCRQDDLPDSEFWKDSGSTNGLQSWCKTCSNRNRTYDPAREREWQLRYKYGIGAQEYDDLCAKQEGLCAICQRAPERRLVVDHDHATGRVRGLLCQLCNKAIGLFKDDPMRLLAAVSYLETP